MERDPRRVLTVADLSVSYRGHGRPVVRGVSFNIDKGESLGLVGESGSGKSTLARSIVGGLRPSQGTVHLAGRDMYCDARRGLRALRRRIQLVPQDPNGSLNPRMTVGAAIGEGVDGSVRRQARRDEVRRLIESVGLDPSLQSRYPHELSGGQRQRIAIARALAAHPAVIVADEVTSALDCSVQAEILNLLAHLLATSDLAMLFISHDLAVVSYLSQSIAVLRYGEVVERGPTRSTLRDPAHPYTRRLVESMPPFVRSTTHLSTSRRSPNA